LGYFYQEITNLKKVVLSSSNLNSNTSSPNQVVDNTATNTVLDEQITTLSNRIKKLELGSSLIGQTLNSCNVITEAYAWVSPKSGFENQLNICSNNIKKLQNNF
jgi:uncharacterized protein (DUF342 family)